MWLEWAPRKTCMVAPGIRLCTSSPYRVGTCQSISPDVIRVGAVMTPNRPKASWVLSAWKCPNIPCLEGGCGFSRINPLSKAETSSDWSLMNAGIATHSSAVQYTSQNHPAVLDTHLYQSCGRTTRLRIPTSHATVVMPPCLDD